MHEEMINQVYSLIASSQLGYPTYPSDYKGTITTTPYLKVHVISGRSDRPSYANTKALMGLLVISIYYPSGSGQKLPSEIANDLDPVFQDRVLNNKLYLKESSLQFMGDDRAVPTVPATSANNDTTLSRADYTVPFTYYGVI